MALLACSCILDPFVYPWASLAIIFFHWWPNCRPLRLLNRFDVRIFSIMMQPFLHTLLIVCFTFCSCNCVLCVQKCRQPEFLGTGIYLEKWGNLFWFHVPSLCVWCLWLHVISFGHHAASNSARSPPGSWQKHPWHKKKRHLSTSFD